MADKINAFPDSFFSLLEGEGVDTQHISYRAVFDRTRDGDHKKSFVAISDSMLFSFSDGLDMLRIPKESIEKLEVEELISNCTVMALLKDGRSVLIAYSSFSCKDGAYHLCESFEKLCSEKSCESEFESEQFCPKCGQRYADRDRKFCPNCVDKKQVVAEFSQFFLKYKKQMLTIVLILIFMSAIGVLTPYMSSQFFYDKVLTEGSPFYGQILFVIGIIVFLNIISHIANMLNGIISSRISANIVYDIKKTIFDAIKRLSVRFFTSRTTGGLINQVNNDANTIYWFFTDGFPYFLMNAVRVVAVVIVMLFIDPLLTFISVGVFPLVIFLIVKFFKIEGTLHSKRYSRQRSMSSMVSDMLNGIRVIKTFSRGKSESERFNKSSSALAGANLKLERFANTAFPSLNFLVYLGTILVWAVGGWMIIKGYSDMTYGQLLAFVAYITMVYDPMYFFVDMVQWGADCLNAVARLMEVMHAKPDVEEPQNPIRKERFEGKVTFKEVKFAYTKGKKVIDGITFDIDAGKCIGIVGHTGAGKSTLANLLIRLYDVDGGEILIDGINVKDLSLEDLHRNIAIVSQETYIFSGTVYENIGYACPDATREQIIHAAKAAGAHDFIVKLQDGYETMVGTGYKDLSGGERQRISIARALLRDPKILILDEATAAMDTQTERKIQNTIDKLVVGRTTITIAHRLSTLRNADYLIVIENGKMPEFGTHKELFAQKGIYYRLYKLQLDALKNIGIEG